MCHHYPEKSETEDTVKESAEDTVREERPARTPDSRLIDKPVQVLKQVTARLG